MEYAARKTFMRQFLGWLAVIFLLESAAFATIFGSVRGIVHDPQHRPIHGAHLILKAQNSDWTQSQDSDSNGEFVFTSVPIGNYSVMASSKGFQQVTQDVIVESDTSPVLHFQLAVQGAQENVIVPETVGGATTDSV